MMSFLGLSKKSSFVNDTLHQPDVSCHKQLLTQHLGDLAFPVASARAWNSLPSSVRNAPSLTTFRRELKTVLFRSSFDND